MNLKSFEFCKSQIFYICNLMYFLSAVTFLFEKDYEVQVTVTNILHLATIFILLHL